MLEQLTLCNFGLIDKMTLEFSRGLNVLTGETGAGKSIIIDGLRALLGERVRITQLKNVNEPCFLQAVFVPDERFREAFKVEMGDGVWQGSDEPELIITRQIFPDGRHRVSVNDGVVTLKTLKQLGRWLMDFHGPHDHQWLLDDQAHGEILDRLAGLEEEVRAVGKIFADYKQVYDRWTTFQSDEAARLREQDVLGFQKKELESVSLEDEDYEESRNQFHRLQNVQELSEVAGHLLRLMADSEASVSETLSQVFPLVRRLIQRDESTQRFETRFDVLQQDVDDLVSEIKAYAESLNFNPEEARENEMVFERYQNLFRKYGSTCAELRAAYERTCRRWQELLHWEDTRAEVESELGTYRKKFEETAERLTKKRRRFADQLEKTIVRELKSLGFPHIEFRVVLERTDGHARGRDRVRFFISPNAGMPPKPLSEIVSSGESARVMLALKRVLVDVDPVQTLIFDEIDAQIGGRLGRVTGKKLKELAERRQVICITHLPQIASFADRHGKVVKEVRDGQTVTTVSFLNDEGRVEELAHMMDGDQSSDLTRRHARTLLKEARKKEPVRDEKTASPLC